MTSFRLMRRVASVTRGAFAGLVGRLESRNPGAVYDAAIDRLVHEQERLREAIGRTAYLRSRVESTLAERRADVTLVERALAAAVREPGDAAALALIQKRRELQHAVRGQEERQRSLAEQIDLAKQHLARLADGTRRLRDERAEMLARRTHAEVRRDVGRIVDSSAALDSSVDEALENARAAIFQLEYVVDAPEPSPDATVVSIEALRREAERAADAHVLADLRRTAVSAP